MMKYGEAFRAAKHTLNTSFSEDKCLSSEEEILWKQDMNIPSFVLLCLFMCGNYKRYSSRSLSSTAPSKDSDQPGHPPSLIRVFTVHSLGS